MKEFFQIYASNPWLIANHVLILGVIVYAAIRMGSQPGPSLCVIFACVLNLANFLAWFVASEVFDLDYESRFFRVFEHFRSAGWLASSVLLYVAVFGWRSGGRSAGWMGTTAYMPQGTLAEPGVGLPAQQGETGAGLPMESSSQPFVDANQYSTGGDSSSVPLYEKRMGRLVYFLNLLVIFTINMFLTFLASQDETMAPVVLIVCIPMIIWAIVCHIRRWHDLGKSGWNVLLLLGPIINIFILFYLLLAPGVQETRPGNRS